MHYDIDYSQLSGDAKRLKGLEDIKYYWGAERYDKIVESVNEAIQETNEKDGTWSLDSFRAIMSFAGVQGYPVTAFYETHVLPNLKHKPIENDNKTIS